ncbi:MAG: transposase, partial [bacterium]|nr:transposase [bacterium]
MCCCVSRTARLQDRGERAGRRHGNFRGEDAARTRAGEPRAREARCAARKADHDQGDNGPEFVAKKVQEWVEYRHINARFIDPGSPWQNAYCESFSGVFRDGCPNRWLFESVREAREATEAWL